MEEEKGEKSSIGSRVKELMFKLDLNQTKFGKSIGGTQNQVYNTIKGNTTPRIAFLEAILKSHPQVSREWLMQGKGEMFLPSLDAAPSQAKSDSYLMNYLEKLESEFRQMRELFHTQLEAKDRQIEMLIGRMGKLDGVIEGTQTRPLWSDKIELIA